MKNGKDYYEILEISSKASDEVIKMAYKALVKKYHPDTKGNSSQAEYDKKMKEINEAYEILSNPEKRAQYDYARKNTYSNENYSENVNYESKQSSIEINNLKTKEEEVKTNKIKKISFIILALVIIGVIIGLIIFSLNYGSEISNEEGLNNTQNLIDDFEETGDIHTETQIELQPETEKEITQKPTNNQSAVNKQPEVTQKPTNNQSISNKQPEVTQQQTNNQETENKQPEKRYCPGEQKCNGAPICPGGKTLDCPGATIKTCTAGTPCSHGLYSSHTYSSETETLICYEAKSCIHGKFQAHDYEENCKHGYSFAHQYTEYCEHGRSTEHLELVNILLHLTIWKNVNMVLMSHIIINILVI